MLEKLVYLLEIEASKFTAWHNTAISTSCFIDFGNYKKTF